MATNSSPEAARGQPLAVTTLFAALSPEFREAVVMRALRFRGQSTGDAGRALDSAIRGNLRIPDYRHPDSAPPHILAEPVAKAMFHSERLAGAALRVWAESHRELQQVVRDHLAAAAIPAEYLDLPENGFRSVWEDEAWEQQLDWIADVATDWAEDDLALMLCYVSGKTIIAEDEDYPEAAAPAEVADYREDAGQPAVSAPAAGVEPESPPAVEPEAAPAGESAAELETAAERETAAAPEPLAAEIPAAALPAYLDPSGDLTGADLLARCVAWLELLPAAAPEWEAAVPAFVSAVNKLQEDNQSHKERFAGLRQTLTEIAAEFAPELDFLEQDAAAWSADRLTDLPAVNRMLETAAELNSLLTEYRQVHHPAASISEERRRRERLADLERQLLQNLGRMSRQMAGDRGNGDQPADTPAAADAELGDPAEIPPSLGETDTADPDDPDFQGELIYEPVEEDVLPAEPPPPAAREAAPATPRSSRARNRRNNSRANRNG